MNLDKQIEVTLRDRLSIYNSRIDSNPVYRDLTKKQVDCSIPKYRNFSMQMLLLMLQKSSLE